jgi:NADH-quinone oxidoreductase subunit J
MVLQALFWMHAGLAVAAALLCVTRRSPVASALWLIVTLFATAVMFLLLDAHFIAALQIMVYSGAIMVLFLFVIMLLNVGDQVATDMKGWFGRGMGLGLGVFVALELWVVTRVIPADPIRLPAGELARMTADRGAVGVMAESLYTNYLVPFELTAILLLASIAGAVVLAKRKI